MDQKKCTKCGKTKPLAQFYWRNKKLKKRKASCKTCQMAYQREWYKANREIQLKKTLQYTKQHIERNFLFVYNHLLDYPCIDCGESNPLVLVFDHVRENKRDSIGRLARNGCSIRTIVAEMEKCEVRCFNCHMLRHAPQNRKRLWSIHNARVGSPIGKGSVCKTD